MNVLVAGWFSFELMGTTAGDAIACDVVCGWLRDAGIEPVVATHLPQRRNEVATDDVEPCDVDAVLFVCGPIGDGPPLDSFLERFSECRLFAVDVTLLQTRADWNPFDLVIERDSHERVNADVTFVAPPQESPVVGVILVGPQGEYPTNRHDVAERAIDRLLVDRGAAPVVIDTRLDVNAGGLRTPAQVESVIARMDAVVTTRLHGAALALRRGVPPVVIDSVPGGSKVLAQMRHIGWPLAFDVAELEPARLAESLEYALGADARAVARRVALHAGSLVESVRRELLAALTAAMAERR